MATRSRQRHIETITRLLSYSLVRALILIYKVESIVIFSKRRYIKAILRNKYKRR